MYCILLDHHKYYWVFKTLFLPPKDELTLVQIKIDKPTALEKSTFGMPLLLLHAIFALAHGEVSNLLSWLSHSLSSCFFSLAAHFLTFGQLVRWPGTEPAAPPTSHMLFMHNITRCNALTSAFMFYEQLINYLSPAAQIYGSRARRNMLSVN